MKLSTVLAIVASSSSVRAFAPTAVDMRHATELNVLTKGKVGSFRKSLSSLDKDNFASNLSGMESFLTDEAGSELYHKSMKRIKIKAKAFGVELPSGYARVAKANEKARAKQDAFVAAKIEAAEASVEVAPEEAVVA